MTPFPSSGLYVVTGTYADTDSLVAAVAAAMRGGAAVVQYRAKGATNSRVTAERLLALCRSAGVPLIVNDDVGLAAEIGADGVHLGKDDPSPEDARRLLGAGAIIGVSCYDSPGRALRAAEDGASYVAFGCFFSSRTKPGAPPARAATLSEARRSLTLPIVAIGGVTAHNGGELLAAGAGLLAVSDAVFGAADPERAARAFQPLFGSAV